VTYNAVNLLTLYAAVAETGYCLVGD